MTVEGRTLRPVVDHEACQACSVCVQGCPAERVPELRGEPESLRGRVYGNGAPAAPPFAEARPRIHPCRSACPLDQDVPGYLRLLAEGRPREALERILEHNPLPGVCGRVCTRPCEAACTRNRLDGPVPIRALKASASLRTPRVNPPAARGDPRVAVVGSGPAGLTATHDLARRGIRSLLIESYDRPGGMLVWAVPRFRLPLDVLNKDIQRILDLGVTLRTGARFGLDVSLTDLRHQGIRALLLAAGTPKGLSLDIPGEEHRGVEDGLSFLRRVQGGDDRSPGERVLVVGGGSAAMDAARTARRLGSEVTVIYRRGRRHMPAERAEVEEAEREGVTLRFQTAPLRVLSNDHSRMRGLSCIRTELRTGTHVTRPRPFPLPGTEHEIAGDGLIVAVGQEPETEQLLQGLDPDEADSFRLDPARPTTGCTGVFAAGDFVSGPSSVVEAMASGRRAARAIGGFLETGESL